MYKAFKTRSRLYIYRSK